MLTIQKLKELKKENRLNPIINNLLATIIGECEQISKDTSNTDIINVLQKMYKDNNTTLEQCPKSRTIQIQELTTENEFISQYLPSKLTEEELIAIISSQLSLNLNMPTIMKYLNINYKGRFNGKTAIKLINSLS